MHITAISKVLVLVYRLKRFTAEAINVCRDIKQGKLLNNLLLKTYEITSK